MAAQKKIGRPREADRSKIRDHRITSAYTAEERFELGEFAHEERLSLSEYIRRIVTRHLTAKRRKR